MNAAKGTGGVFVTERARPHAPSLGEPPPSTSIAVRRWRAMLDWSAQDVALLECPGLYAGRRGFDALRASTVLAPEASWRLSLTPPAAFEPTPGLWTAALADWPYDGPAFGGPSADPRWAVGRADALLAPTRAAAAAFRSAGCGEVVVAATPIAPRREMEAALASSTAAPGARPLRRLSTRLERAAIWSFEDGAFAPRRLPDALERRRGPLHLARIDLAKDRGDGLRLVRVMADAAAAMATGRLVLALELGDETFEGLLGDPGARRAFERAGHGLGVLVEPLDETTWRDLAAAADAVVAPSAGSVGSAADDAVWLAIAAGCGCAVIVPDCPPCSEWLEWGAAPTRAARFRATREAAGVSAWCVDPIGLAHTLGGAERIAAGATAVGARLIDVACFETVWRRIWRLAGSARIR